MGEWMGVFEVCAVFHDDDCTSRLVVEITTVLARDTEHARLKAARLVPDDVDIGAVEVLVRPFR